MDDKKYIDKEAFIALQRKQYCVNCERRKGTKNGKRIFVYGIGETPCRACDIEDMIDAVDDFLPADVVPVVYGKWIFQYSSTDSEPYYSFCSHCREPIKSTRAYKIYKFCPHCGAKMDEAE